MILVAGGTGRLGSAVTNLLRRRGVPVRVLSRGLAPHPGTFDTEVELVRGDVRDRGPEPMTLTRLAEMIMAQRGSTGEPRQIPRAMLHVLANTVGRLRPEIALQARAALAMDELPTTNDAALRTEFPDLPCTPVSQVVAALPR